MFCKKSAKIHIIFAVFKLFKADCSNKTGLDTLGKGEISIVSSAKIDKLDTLDLSEPKPAAHAPEDDDN